jgi:EmrB/QacA subfamily drug resistance transporter
MSRTTVIFLVTIVGNALGTLDLSVVNVALPEIGKHFSDAAPNSVAWVVTVYPIVFAGLLVPAGRIADRSGRKRVYEIGLVIFLGGTLLSGLAPALWLLILGRVLQAAGAAMISPASLGAILASVTQERRSAATTLWAAAGFAATALGPIVGGAAVEIAGWRSAFLVQVPVALAIMLASRLTLTESRPPAGTARPDPVAAALATAAVSALTAAILKGNDWGWASQPITGLIAGGVVSSLLLALRSARHPAPLIDPALFRNRSFSTGVAGIAVFGSSYFALLVAQVQFLQTVWRYSPLQAGLAVSMQGATIAVLAPWTGRLAARVGHQLLIVPGSILFGAAVIWTALAAESAPNYLWLWLPVTVLAGSGVALSMPILNAAAVSTAPAHLLSVAGGAVQTARQCGGAIGIAATFALLGSSTAPHTAGAFEPVWTYIAVGAITTGLIAYAGLPTRQALTGAARPGRTAAEPD